MVKFYLNEELFTEDYRETGINRTMYWAVRNRKQTGNKLLDLDDVIWNTDPPEIVDTLKRMGETQFTVSSRMSSLVQTLMELSKLGAEIIGMTEVKSRYAAVGANELERIPALLLKLK